MASGVLECVEFIEMMPNNFENKKKRFKFSVLQSKYSESTFDKKTYFSRFLLLKSSTESFFLKC